MNTKIELENNHLRHCFVPGYCLWQTNSTTVISLAFRFFFLPFIFSQHKFSCRFHSHCLKCVLNVDSKTHFKSHDDKVGRENIENQYTVFLIDSILKSLNINILSDVRISCLLFVDYFDLAAPPTTPFSKSKNNMKRELSKFEALNSDHNDHNTFKC